VSSQNGSGRHTLDEGFSTRNRMVAVESAPPAPWDRRDACGWQIGAVLSRRRLVRSRLAGYSGAVSASATPSGSLNGSTAIPNGGRSVISLCSTPRSSKVRAAASSAARSATAKLK
jgi:hypothetical protein